AGVALWLRVGAGADARHRAGDARVLQAQGLVVMRIAVVGAGGVGGYFGAKLARAGESVVVLARGAHLDAIRRDGLRVRSAVDGEFTAKVDAVDSFAGQPAVDMALFCVKSFDTRTAAGTLRPVLGPDTGVVSLQNGVDNEEILDEVLGAGRALAGAAFVFTTLDSPGALAPPRPG